jgi:hypothetical protein
MPPLLKHKKVPGKQAKALEKCKGVGIRGLVAAGSIAGHYNPLFRMYTLAQCISILNEIKIILKVSEVF